MSTNVCGPAAPVQTNTSNYTPPATTSAKVCVEPPTQCIDNSSPSAAAQKKAEKAVGLSHSRSAPTEQGRTAQPKGTVRAGELARDVQSTTNRDATGTTAASAVAINSVGTSTSAKFQQHAYSHARTVGAGHSQTAVQLRKMKGKLQKLENAVKNGAGPKAQKQLAAGRAEYKAAKGAWTANKPLAAEANAFMKNNSGLKSGGSNPSKVAKGSERFYKALKASQTGRRVLSGLKVITNPRVTKGLAILGGGLDAVSAYKNSTNRTTEGKVLNGTLAGLGNIAITANPIGAVADLLAPEGYRPSDITRGGSSAISAMVEGAVTGDLRAAQDFHTRSVGGDYGKVMQTASESGAYWAKHGVGNTLKNFGSEFMGLFR
jgi:hypothetical protein